MEECHNYTENSVLLFIYFFKKMPFHSAVYQITLKMALIFLAKDR